MKCPRTGCSGNAIQDAQYGILPCKRCREKDTKHIKKLKRKPEFLTVTMRDRIVTQRDHFAKDILQPFIGNEPNPDFVKAYPEYRDTYFTTEQLKKI